MAFLISAPEVRRTNKPHPTIAREAGPLQRPRFPDARDDDGRGEVVPDA